MVGVIRNKHYHQENICYLTSGVILALYDWLNNFCCILVALAVDFIERHGPSNEMHRQLQL